MKRILLGALGSLGALLTAGLNHAWERPHYQRQYGARRQYRAAFKLGGVPTDKRNWHNPADPIQAARIEAAAVKHARRAEKQSYQAMRTLNGMHAVICAAYAKHEVGFACPLNLNPFYVAK